MTKKIKSSRLIGIVRSALTLLGITFVVGDDKTEAASNAKANAERPAIERLDQIRSDFVGQPTSFDGDEIAWDNWDNWQNWDNWANHWGNY